MTFATPFARTPSPLIRSRITPIAASLLVGLASLGCHSEVEGDPAPTHTDVQSIVGGTPELDRPYAIALRFEYPPGSGTYYLRCSASLIGRRTVLTAAHCIIGDTLPPPDDIAFGPELATPEATVPIQSMVAHPLYDDVTVEYDIAVIQLAADAPRQPVGLVRETIPQGTGSKFTGPDVTFVGYGDTFYGEGRGGKRLVVSYPIYAGGPFLLQDFLIPESAWLWVDQNRAEATCSGDSGGPAFFQEGGVERQLGVHSTSNCVNAGTDSRSDQVMIDSFLQQHIDAFEQNDPCRGDGACDPSCQSSGELVDPDCAEDHCGADGVCARSCVWPVDPDCGWSTTSFCNGGDGACNPDCGVLDPDCEGFCGNDDVCVTSCASPDPDCAEEPGAGGAGGAGGQASGGFGGGEAGAGAGGDDGDDGGSSAEGEDDGCGCRTAGATDERSRAPWLLLGLAAAVGWRRRRSS